MKRFRINVLLLLTAVLIVNVVAGNLAVGYDRGKRAALIKDIRGRVWHIRQGIREKIKAAIMVELNKGDKLEIPKGSGAKVIYYQGKREEEYSENSIIEIGTDGGDVIKGGEKKTWIRDRIHLKNPIKPSPYGDNESIGAFFVRGRQVPVPTDYFSSTGVKRYAVVIGVSKFKDPSIPQLKYADRDAQAFYDHLVSPYGGSFNPENILLLKNEEATLEAVKNALTGFLKRAVDDDFIIIYIASHGESEPDRPENLYLLTHDTKTSRLSSTAYSMDYINTDMERYISANRLIFIADACHAGKIAGSGVLARGFSNTINNALAALSSTREGWAMMTASRAAEVSLESDKWGGGHGAFTYFLLNGLYGKADIAGNYNGVITITEAFDYVSNMVKYETENAQHPVLTGDFDNNLPLGFIPAEGVERNNDILKEAEFGNSLILNGTLHITSNLKAADIYIGNDLIGKTSPNGSFIKELPSGSVKVSIRKGGKVDHEKLVYINPDEVTRVNYLRERSVEPVGRNKNILKDEKELEDSIDKIMKELEQIRGAQIGMDGMKGEQPGNSLDEDTANHKQTDTVPVSIRQFNTNMKAIASQSDMEIVRMRVIGELGRVPGVSVVERELGNLKAILREQRLGGSILADKMYRVELGKIIGADFICFSSVTNDYNSNDLVLRMEVVETATTRIDAFEYRFKDNDMSIVNARNIALKLKNIVLKKR